MAKRSGTVLVDRQELMMWILEFGGG